MEIGDEEVQDVEEDDRIIVDAFVFIEITIITTTTMPGMDGKMQDYFFKMMEFQIIDLIHMKKCLR